MRNFPNKMRIQENRYWWFRLKQTGYLPDVLQILTPREKKALKKWFDWTDKTNSGIGESNIPLISTLVSIINGNGISKIVQLGHYTGYSSLFIAAALKRMNKGHLFSIDIDPWATGLADDLVQKAGVSKRVTHHLGDSASKESLDAAISELEEIDLIYIDSDHTYKHAKAELELWWSAIKPGGLMIMHDSSVFATSFGNVPDKGVKVAADEFFKKINLNYLNLNSEVEANVDPDKLVYVDSCGILIAQKPFNSTPQV